MAKWTGTPYVVLHTHPNHLVLDQMCREQLFSTGNLIGFHEVSLYSLQPEMLTRYTRRPLTVILWGMADRYGVGPALGVEIITLPAETYSSDIGHIVENRRLVYYTRYREPTEDEVRIPA